MGLTPSFLINILRKIQKGVEHFGFTFRDYTSYHVRSSYQYQWDLTTEEKANTTFICSKYIYIWSINCSNCITNNGSFHHVYFTSIQLTSYTYSSINKWFLSIRTNQYFPPFF